MILNRIQNIFPVDSFPYRVIGSELGLAEEEVFRRVEDLKKTAVIRRLGGIFDSRRLGYKSTLCAAKVPDARIRSAAEFLDGISEVTHNYLRDHTLNMWFTVIALSQERLDQIIESVRLALGSNELYSLPAEKVFKISVTFRLGNGMDPDRKEHKQEIRIYSGKKSSREMNLNGDAFTEKDKQLIRCLQGNLPSSLRPFAELAARLQWNEAEVLSRIQRFLDNGALRRLGAVLYHRTAGFTSNAMGVWIVPEARIDEVGATMAKFEQVSHCYQRRGFPGWPYNLFTMVHGVPTRSAGEYGRHLQGTE
jgi:DNA-binding Lrp family transcriptional regulator